MPAIKKKPIKKVRVSAAKIKKPTTLVSRLSSKKWLVIAFLVVFGGIGTYFVASSSAVTSQQNCFNGTGPSKGVWAWNNTYTYAKGGWCMNAGRNAATGALGDKRLVWQADGNLVIYRGVAANTSPVWASNTAGRGSTLLFAADGTLVISDSNKKQIWSSVDAGSKSGTLLGNQYDLSFLYGFVGTNWINNMMTRESNSVYNRNTIYWNLLFPR